MSWIDQFYSTPIAVPISILALLFIGILGLKGKGRQAMLGLTLFLYVRYLLWRGLYTLNTDDLAGTLISVTLLLAEVYGLIQFVFFTIQAWNPIEREAQPIVTYRTVDIFVTVVNEPLEILRRTVVGCLNQDYPREQYRVYVLDDGQRDDVRSLADSLGCGYIRRTERLHAKAGNINHALQQTSGDLIAIFDTDQVPTSGFLRETVGFFENDRVAFVQTPHHFYNQDIFQKNLRLESYVKAEQGLFFHVLQAGRDAHNSAFFAGSSGIFRRGPLMEIGGFQTDTITEDIHTSMLVHARGYESRYLNKVLSAGLEPETFGGYLKQRTRWAIGSLQMLIRCNPLTLKGLSWVQRIDYLGAPYYFLHGLPRVLCLIAPLPALWFGIAPVHAGVDSIVHFFGSFFLASLVMMRTVSNGTRNAFWSDVYETVLCFSLSVASLATLLRPNKPRPFVVTPKGEKIEEHGIREASFVTPQLIVFGLMVGGLVVGTQAWWEGRAIPGLEVALFWGAANLLLLAIAILCAHEPPQWRNTFRLAHRAPCVVSSGHVRVIGRTKDISEGGVCIQVDEPFLSPSRHVLLQVERPNGAQLVLQGWMISQERVGSRCEIGVKFVDPSEANSRMIIEEMFSRAEVWEEDPARTAGIWKSLWAFAVAFRVVRLSRRTAKRLFPRVLRRLSCEIQMHGRSYSGQTRNLSFSGLAVAIEGECPDRHSRGLLLLQGVVLKVELIDSMRSGSKTIAQFSIDGIENGEDQWRALNLSGGSSS